MKRTLIEKNPNWVNEANAIVGLPQTESGLRDLLVYEVETPEGKVMLNNGKSMTEGELDAILERDWWSVKDCIVRAYKPCYRPQPADCYRPIHPRQLVFVEAWRTELC